MKRRDPSPDDKQQLVKAYNLLIGFMKNHPDIENTLWISVCMNIWLESFKISGATLQELTEELERIKEMYKLKLSV